MVRSYEKKKRRDLEDARRGCTQLPFRRIITLRSGHQVEAGPVNPATVMPFSCLCGGAFKTPQALIQHRKHCRVVRVDGLAPAGGGSSSGGLALAGGGSSSGGLAVAFDSSSSGGLAFAGGGSSSGGLAFAGGGSSSDGRDFHGGVDSNSLAPVGGPVWASTCAGWGIQAAYWRRKPSVCANVVRFFGPPKSVVEPPPTPPPPPLPPPLQPPPPSPRSGIRGVRRKFSKGADKRHQYDSTYKTAVIDWMEKHVDLHRGHQSLVFAAAAEFKVPAHHGEVLASLVMGPKAKQIINKKRSKPLLGGGGNTAIEKIAEKLLRDRIKERKTVSNFYTSSEDTPVAAVATRFDFVMPACSHCDREGALVCEGCRDIFCMQCIREQLNGRQQCGCQRARTAQTASQHHGEWNWCAREVVTSSVCTTSETEGYEHNSHGPNRFSSGRFQMKVIQMMEVGMILNVWELCIMCGSCFQFSAF